MTELEEQLTQEVEALTSEIKLLQEQLNYLTRKVFGKSKESVENIPDGQLNLFDQDEFEAPVVIEEKVPGYTRKKKQTGTKAEKMAKFSEQAIHCEIKHCMCIVCGSEMKDIGAKKVREELTIVPVEILRKALYQHSYACPSCEKNGKTNIVSAPVPTPLIPNSIADETIVTETILQKYKQKVPAYRQEKWWHALGVELSRDNICNWHILAVHNALEELYEQLHKRLCEQKILHADETSYKVLSSSKEKNYYWLFQSGKHEEHQITLYHYAESRGQEVPQAFLKDFSGYLHCDGWSPYEHLENVTIMNCGAHVRRKFFEVLPKDFNKNPNKKNPGFIGMSYWDKLFKIERELAELSSEERLKQRKIQLKPVLDEFYAWCEQLNPLKGSKLGKAITYAFNHRKGIETILEDGDLELSNNRAERSIKELVMGRKNWLFSASFEGAICSGILLSIIKTAEANNLDIQKYLNFLFREIPNLEQRTPEAISAYLPWNELVQKQCRRKN
jgi:transposase